MACADADKQVLAQAIGRWPDFPKQGVVFRDVLPIFNEPRALDIALKWMRRQIPAECTVIVSPESRGFLFGCPLAASMKLRFVPARKPGKTPGPLLSATYDLEYGQATLQIQEGAIKPTDKVVIVDDIFATGGTLDAISRMVVGEVGAEILKSICLLEITGLTKVPRAADLNVVTCLSFGEAD